MNVDSCRVGAELVGQLEGVRSGVALLHRRDHEGGEVGGVLNVVPLIPVGQGPTRTDPLDGGCRVSREHPCHSQGLPRLGTDVLRKSFDLWWGACRRRGERVSDEGFTYVNKV